MIVQIGAYFDRSFIRLDLADLVELLDACAGLDEPLYYLDFGDAWEELTLSLYPGKFTRLTFSYVC